MSLAQCCRTPLWLTLIVLLVTTACTTEIYAPTTQNPPPSEPFNAFGQFRLEPVTLNPAFAEAGYNQSARAAIERNLQSALVPTLTEWDKGRGRTLVIQPTIDEIKFIGGAARVWTGAMSGSSAVVMRVTYTDQQTGTTIAQPVFYQHAAAMGGAWSFGGTDNAMLARIAELIATYTRNNYAAAVGGPSGAPAERVKGG
jgi:hypothetical protein